MSLNYFSICVSLSYNHQNLNSVHSCVNCT